MLVAGYFPKNYIHVFHLPKAFLFGKLEVNFHVLTALSGLFWSCTENVTTWLANNCNTHIAQYLTK